VDDGKLLGFAHFRFDMDFDDEVSNGIKLLCF
jgi:hypothetical protein